MGMDHSICCLKTEKLKDLVLWVSCLLSGGKFISIVMVVFFGLSALIAGVGALL